MNVSSSPAAISSPCFHGAGCWGEWDINAIVSLKSALVPLVLLDRKACNGIDVCNGVMNFVIQTTFVHIGVKLLPVSVAIAGRLMSQGMRSCCVCNTSPAPGFGE